MTNKSNENLFRVTLLGTGTPVPSISRFGPCILVEAGSEALIFDVGRGAVLRFHQIGIPMEKLTSLFLTHLHSDHLVGLPDLWLTGWVLGRHQTPLHVWGPIGTGKMMSKLEEAFEYDIHVRRDLDEKFPAQGISVIVQEISDGIVYEKKGVKVTAFTVDHRPVEPSFGYRIDFNSRSVVLSGDTRFNENLINHSKGVNLLVHEVCVASDGMLESEIIQCVVAHHTSPQEAGTVFSKVKPDLAVYTHMGLLDVNEEDVLTLTKETYSGPVVIGEDLMSFTIGDTIQVKQM